MLRNEYLVISRYPTQYSVRLTEKEDRSIDCIILFMSDRNIEMLTFKARTTLTRKLCCECVGIIRIKNVEDKYAFMSDDIPVQGEPITVYSYYVELQQSSPNLKTCEVFDNQ